MDEALGVAKLFQHLHDVSVQNQILCKVGPHYYQMEPSSKVVELIHHVDE
jgi:hypothetical protein